MEKLKFKPLPKLKAPEHKPFKDLVKTAIVAAGSIVLIKAAADVLND
jgi:hypothetical protein